MFLVFSIINLKLFTNIYPAFIDVAINYVLRVYYTTTSIISCHHVHWALLIIVLFCVHFHCAQKRQDGAGALGEQMSLSSSEESAWTASSNESLVNAARADELHVSPGGDGSGDGEGSRFTYEVIVVDDGSPAPDRTTDVALSYSRRYGSDRVRVLTGARNRGKGGAIRVVRSITHIHILYICSCSCARVRVEALCLVSLLF